MIHKIIMFIFDVLSGIFMILSEDENPVRRCLLHFVYVALRFFAELPPVKSFFKKASELLRRIVKNDNSGE